MDTNIKLISDKPLYYKTFIDMENESYETDPEMNEQFRDPGFRREVQSSFLSYDYIKEVSPYMRHLLMKPQKLEIDQPNVYVAWCLMTNTLYACMDCLMLDIDSYKLPNGLDPNIEDLLPHCMCQLDAVINDVKSNTNDLSHSRQPTWMNHKCKVKPSTKKGVKPPPCTFRYRVFKSRAGWHAFLISHKMHYRDEKAIELMIEGRTDFFYITLAYLRGWCVRLNRKSSEDHELVMTQGLYTYIGDVIRGKIVPRTDSSVTPIDECVRLIDFHVRLTQLAVDESPVYGK